VGRIPPKHVTSHRKSRQAVNIIGNKLLGISNRGLLRTDEAISRKARKPANPAGTSFMVF